MRNIAYKIIKEYTMTGAELERLLKKHGWIITNGKAHNQATHADKCGIKIAIPRHRKDLPTGTLHQILNTAGLPEEK
jgi:predicted RNA binding protein YcfA (HicA-like mRNA interferase family)